MIMLKRYHLSHKCITMKTDFFSFKGFNKMLLLAIILIMSLPGCQKDDINTKIVEKGNYTGTFESGYNLSLVQDSVFLNISSGYYYCSTNLPYNYGAGKIEISATTLNFIDTLFFPVPALYITGFALSGEYKYQYDGINLILEKLDDNEDLTYKLKKVN